MKKHLLSVSIILMLLSGCFAPVNLTYESARTLRKGEVDVQGNYSRYCDIEGSLNNDYETTNYNNNYGFKIGYGLKDGHTIKLRYEKLLVNQDNYSFGSLDFSDPFESVSYIEVENKFKFKRWDKDIAIGIPVGYYFIKYDNLSSDGILAIDPRIYFTTPLNASNTFELNIIPKAHMFLSEGIGVNPGISVGFGFSNDLSKWAIRPEFGYDGYFSFGVGLNVNLISVTQEK